MAGCWNTLPNRRAVLADETFLCNDGPPQCKITAIWMLYPHRMGVLIIDGANLTALEER